MRTGALAALAVAAFAHTAHAAPIALPPSAPSLRAPPANELMYYGGRVISNVEVVAVFWGPNVDATVTSQIGAFYAAIVKSSYIDWLTEYDTIGKKGTADLLPGSNQHIGRGTFAGAKTITPAHTAATLTDADVSAELVAQLQAGHLPPPTFDAGGNVNTIYMIDFPPGVSIALMGLTSCAPSMGFGAYHFTVKYGGKSVPYGVHPDCGYPWDAATRIHSHELVEAITDTEVGLADQLAPTTRPIAWATVAATAWDSQEIADVCQSSMIPSANVAGYAVQKEWSNYVGDCVGGVPICDGTMQPPACRPCTAYDDGNACDGATPVCATQGAKVGQCVAAPVDAGAPDASRDAAADARVADAAVEDAGANGAAPVDAGCGCGVVESSTDARALALSLACACALAARRRRSR